MSQVLYICILGFHLSLPQAISMMITDTHKRGHLLFTKVRLTGCYTSGLSLKRDFRDSS